MKLERLARKVIEITFYALLLIVPLIVVTGNYEVFQFNKMVTVYLGTTIITTAWIIKTIQQKRFSLAHTPLTIPLLLFLASQSISTLLSIEPRTSIFGYYSRFHGGLLSTVSYILLYFAFVSNAQPATINFSDKGEGGEQISGGWIGQALSLVSNMKVSLTGFANRIQPKKFRSPISKTSPFLLVLLFSATIVAIYGILEHFGIDEHFWVQDVRNRVFSTMGQPNWLAAFLILITPLTLAFAQRTQFVIWNLAFGIFYLTLLYTKSRSGLFGFAVMYAIFWILLLLQTFLLQQSNGLSKKRSLINFFSTSFVILVITLFVGTPFTPSIGQILNRSNQQRTATPQVIESMTSPPPAQENSGGTPSEEIRKIVWKGSINIWKHWPIFGSGVETFAYSYYNFRPVEHNFVSEWDFLYNKAHNEHLNLLATTGIVGLGTYLLIIATYTRWSLKRIGIMKYESRIMDGNTTKNKPAHNSLFIIHHSLPIALLSGFLGLQVALFFGFSTVTDGFLFFMFPAFAFAIEENGSSSKTLSFGKQSSKTSLLQKLLILLTLLMSLYVVVGIAKYWYADRLFTQGKSLTNANRMAEGLTLMQKASQLRPNEPLFHDRLALDFARSAVALSISGEATEAAQLSELSAAHSDLTVLENPVHLNYLKNRAATMLHLATIDPRYRTFAIEALERARQLSPTDPNVPYNLGLIHMETNDLQKALEEEQQAVGLKPDYELPRIALAQVYEKLGMPEKAMEVYQDFLNYDPDNQTATNAIQRLATEAGVRNKE
ncbi:MAG: hypothetical protein A2785_01695 [Candidatus Chisholmbacteria bacterium RIFCSPHIGHO2_01_FULL_49_18]|uniref:O-antigen ligase-related domain-containing protein n=2 Tax=Candidatus Chisholmiibacteriota TaxID=1817900 RepID=A0A1G1VLS1_9BACT|nr:MAG: hypothetical protein A2785_01695 [Candidatus Chisholmbacteria bacterium RIFCSPHIGHO2_01_FULL_49_18]OGY21741.1 MAG: hypothetical protein A3A65_02120 [Candidatus Chisholmbacteria bacterium RIFCSPLOWO2_01_FULL_49_14]